ncbi:MAG: DNA-directed RNA polymerase subunit omega [Deltaproteobacteria bacterium RBG_13_52_11]|nr:MAG: DNA-directed RNA polymerase subunit omega [Deltaproteobacteria bacterium RBG_13_52_11]
MARITVEDCLERVESRFSLVILATKRVKMLLKGAPTLVSTDNKFIVNALREIAAGKVSYTYETEGGRGEAEGPRVKLVEKDEEGQGPAES